jgi:hypothetical protein
LDLSFNNISEASLTTQEGDIYSTLAPLLVFPASHDAIPLYERVVNLAGNSLNYLERTLVLKQPPLVGLYEFYRVSIYPQQDDLCAEEKLEVSPEFRNPFWGNILIRLNAIQTFEKMCGGRNCIDGVRVLGSTKFSFCRHSTNCTYPCVTFDSSPPGFTLPSIHYTGLFILDWYVISPILLFDCDLKFVNFCSISLFFSFIILFLFTFIIYLFIYLFIYLLSFN